MSNKTEIEVIKLIIAERKKTHSTIDAIDIISRLREIADNYGDILECLKKEGVIREEKSELEKLWDNKKDKRWDKL